MAEKRRRRSSKHDVGARWGVAVRLADGEIIYYHVNSERQDLQGKPLVLWGRQSQAHRFRSEQDALSVASKMQINSDAREYLVVRLPAAQ